MSSIRSLSRSWRRRCVRRTVIRITAPTWAPISRSPSRTARARTATKSQSQSPSIEALDEKASGGGRTTNKLNCVLFAFHATFSLAIIEQLFKISFFLFFCFIKIFFRIKYKFKIVCFVKPYSLTLFLLLFSNVASK